jgi:PAS domain S-box-containing protein
VFELPIPAVVSVAFANLLMAGVFGVLHLRERSPGLSFFALAWMLEAARHFLSLAPVNVVTFFAGGLAFAAAVLTLVEGSFRLAGRRPSSALRALVVALVVWQAIVFFWGPSFIVWHLPVSLFAAGMRLVVARMLWAAGGPWLGRGVAAFAMGLWGLHALSYPFLANVPSAAPWGFALSALLGLITALGVVMTYFDRSRAEADSSEARLRSLFEGASDGIATLDDRGHVLTANLALARLLGFREPSEIEGRELGALVAREHAFSDATRRGVETWHCPDGKTRLVSVSLSKVRTGGHLDRIDVFVRDVTQETRLEAELEQRRRLEALGRLAGGVAHDFNNLLQVISGAAELAMRPGDAEQRAQHLDIALEASARGAELTRQLLAFGRRQTVVPRPIDLAAVVREFSEWVGRLLGDHVLLDLDLAPGAHVISADRGQLEQILVNLVTNARDAMPDGGRVRIGVRRDDGGVCLEVEDEGTGMDDATRAHIFEPFFTTKERGRGTGLGLATVHGVATQHGWALSVETEPARGTCFAIRFPSAAEDVAPVSPPPEREVVPRAGRVLVVDDDAEIRRLLATILSDAGYETRALTPGPEAIACARTPGWDVLITDVEMPGTSGPELARSAREALPELGVVLMSGREAEGGVSLDARSVFLAKPFRSDDLVRAVEGARKS